jgi:uncharacterized protein YodC (DUF2158 family)
MSKREEGSFSENQLRLIAPWHGYEVELGDFVRLNSGSPLGLVTDLENGEAKVTWFTTPIQHDEINSRCLRPTRTQRDG